MIQARTLAVFAALLVVGGLTAQVGAVPGVTAQQASPTEQAGNTGVAVDSLTAPESVAPNSTADVAATVTNNQNTTVTESVAFRFDGAVVDRTLVTLEPNESETVQFSADTTGIEPGDYRHGVFTEDDGQVAAVTVSDSFTLESLDAPTNATAGDNITVNASVANPNDFNTTQTVEFRLGGQPLASESVTLDANESTDVTFTVDTTGVEPDTYTHSVFTRD
ncbi:MAG: CARDB domain-containing protein, partial [Haloarcula sp.]